MWPVVECWLKAPSPTSTLRLALHLTTTSTPASGDFAVAKVRSTSTHPYSALSTGSSDLTHERLEPRAAAGFPSPRHRLRHSGEPPRQLSNFRAHSCRRK